MTKIFPAILTLLLLCGVILVAAPTSFEASARGESRNHVGARRCGSCHVSEYETWAKGPHANAHLTLNTKESNNIKCVSCHSLAETTDPLLAGVQCESCHGSGKHYQADHVMRDKELSKLLGLREQSAEVCQQCHTEMSPSVEKFDYDAFWSRISHGPKK